MINSLDNNELKYWLVLNAHPSIGARTIGKLFKKYHKISKVWQTNDTDLAKAGLTPDQVKYVKEAIATIDPEKELIKLKKYQLSVLTLADKNYPKMLKEIFDSPAVLYYKGQILPQDDIALAVVGSRKYTPYGQKATEDIVFRLAKSGLTIVSGLALGIDAIAHHATLEAKGRTLAVLGCGLDQIYPTANIRLADKILSTNSGAIISEFPVGTTSYRSNFPIRNRIIAGLSLGTLVVEAAPDSGSLITAQAALGYNREVFAIPGSIFSESSVGTNRLIQMGAKLITSPTDILTELNLEEKIKQNKAQVVIPDSKEEQILLDLLIKPMTVDNLIIASKLPPTLVNSTLIMLEMKGMILNMGGTRYQIKGKLGKN